MAEEINIISVDQLKEKTSIEDTDLFMIGDEGSGNLRKVTAENVKGGLGLDKINEAINELEQEIKETKITYDSETESLIIGD